jgi:hypothetical protein
MDELEASAQVRGVLEATMDTCRNMLDVLELPVTLAVMVVRVDVPGVGPVSVALSGPAGRMAEASRLAAEGARVLADAASEDRDR